MSTLFVQVQGRKGLVEISVTEDVTGRNLRQALCSAGCSTDPGGFVFVDEADEPFSFDGNSPIEEVKDGARIHVTRCKHIQVTVHYAGRKIERSFGPGVRVGNVKKWAVREFNIDHTDAAEHVLMLCDSQSQPPTDTPLHTLVGEDGCAVCFNLVPEKRVEGSS